MKKILSIALLLLLFCFMATGCQKIAETKDALMSSNKAKLYNEEEVSPEDKAGLFYVQFPLDGTEEVIAITKYNGKNASVEIPSTIDSLPVILMNEGAFSDCEALEGITK